MQRPDTWSACAALYASGAASFSAPFAEEALRRVSLARPDSVLDVAAGPGTLAMLAAPNAARVLATDFSHGMIDQLRLRAGREGAGNVEGAVMDAQALALRAGSFDAAFCMFGFMFIPDRARAFREMLRVLRPDGRALVATWGPIDRRPMMKVGFDAMAETFPDLPRPAKGDLQEPAECVREMKEAGFRDVEARVFASTVRVESAEHYLKVLGGCAPLQAIRIAMGDKAWAVAETRLIEAVRARLAQAPADLGAEAVLTVGTR